MIDPISQVTIGICAAAFLVFNLLHNYIHRVVIEEDDSWFFIKAGSLYMRSDYCWDRGQENAIIFSSLEEAKKFYESSKHRKERKKIIHEI